MSSFILAIVTLCSLAALYVLALRLREMSLSRTKAGFLLLHIAGATFSGWVALQALLYAVVDVSNVAGIAFVLCYLHVSKQPWDAGPPAYSYRDTVIEPAESTLAP